MREIFGMVWYFFSEGHKAWRVDQENVFNLWGHDLDISGWELFG